MDRRPYRKVHGRAFEKGKGAVAVYIPVMACIGSLPDQ
jgi:hypothetical protein